MIEQVMSLKKDYFNYKEENKMSFTHKIVGKILGDKKSKSRWSPYENEYDLSPKEKMEGFGRNKPKSASVSDNFKPREERHERTISTSSGDGLHSLVSRIIIDKPSKNKRCK